MESKANIKNGNAVKSKKQNEDEKLNIQLSSASDRN